MKHGNRINILNPIALSVPLEIILRDQQEPPHVRKSGLYSGIREIIPSGILDTECGKLCLWNPENGSGDSESH